MSDLAPLLGLSSALTKMVADASPGIVTAGICVGERGLSHCAAQQIVLRFGAASKLEGLLQRFVD